jgi:Rrf2 family protein
MTNQPKDLKHKGSDANTSAAGNLNSRKTAHSFSMQLTRAADYALCAMIHLASQTEAKRAFLPDLAHTTGAPEGFLSKVLQSLCLVGFVASHRGQFGGFEILPVGRAATVAADIQSIEGPISLNVCMDAEISCSRKSFCPAHPVWVEAQAAMLAVLNAKTVADLAAIPPARGRGVATKVLGDA